MSEKPAVYKCGNVIKVSFHSHFTTYNPPPPYRVKKFQLTREPAKEGEDGMLTQIISGGQTGADRAALDAGLALDFKVGGYCPKGRLSEDGPIPVEYPLVELEGGYRQRTKKNIEESDGTAIFYSADIQGGTEQTLSFCIKLSKPYKLIDITLVDNDRAALALKSFVDDNQISVLNVAGPRLSKCPEIYDYVREVIGQVISKSA